MQMHELSKSWLLRGISLNTESSLTLHVMVFLVQHTCFSSPNIVFYYLLLFFSVVLLKC